MKRVLLFFSVVLVFASCESELNPDFSFLEGSWKMQIDDSTYLLESWEKINHEHYKALNYEISPTGMKLSQENEIEITDSGTYLRATIEALDGGRQFEFKLVADTDNKYIFENDEFEVPLTFWYENIDENNMEVGSERGDEKNIVPYIKENKTAL